MKLVWICLFVLLLYSLPAEMSYEEWKSQQEQEYQSYIDQQDREFSDFLKREWTAFQAFEAEHFVSEPKPREIPIREEEPLQEIPTVEEVKDIEVPQKPVKIEQPPIRESVQIIQTKNETLYELVFWGLPVDIRIPNELKLSGMPQVNEKKVSDFWFEISSKDYQSVLEQIQTYRQQMKLNDWAYCLFLNEIAYNLSPYDNDVKKLFIWFMLLKSGYDAKVGIGENSIALLLPSQNNVYGVPYLVIDGKSYYLVNFTDSNSVVMDIRTFEGSYPDADAMIDFGMDENLQFSTMLMERELQFTYLGEEYNIPVVYNINIVNFLENYPHTDLEIYFSTTLSSEAEYSIISSLSPIMEGKTKTEALNLLLRFVQTAFEYKTDAEHFGREKIMFPEEILHYPYSDCDDRAVFFSYLVTNLLGLEVVALDYPGHLATAVYLDVDIPGDKIEYNGRKYLICDPTYINANIGMTMRQFRQTEPKVVEFSDL